MAQNESQGGSPLEGAEIRALAELALCESLAQTSGGPPGGARADGRGRGPALGAGRAPSLVSLYRRLRAGTERVVRRSVSGRRASCTIWSGTGRRSFFKPTSSPRRTTPS